MSIIRAPQVVFSYVKEIFDDKDNGKDGGFVREDIGVVTFQNTGHKYDDIEISETPGRGCVHCGSDLISRELNRNLGRRLCRICAASHLKLITKTSCREMYMLSNEEMKSLPFISRVNPHKSAWSNMILYAEEDAKQLAIEKYGSLEEMERIRVKRKNRLSELKKKRIRKGIKELRRMTILNTRRVERHVHKFKRISGNMSRCECGFEISDEEI